MKNAKIAVLIFIASALLTSSCSKKIPPPKYKHSIQEDDLSTWPDECRDDATDVSRSSCPKKTLSWVYHNMGDLFYDWQKADDDLKHAEKKGQLKLEACQSELDGLWCQWWIWSLIGAAAGAAIGFGTGFGVKASLKKSVRHLLPGVTLESVMGASSGFR